MLPSLQSNLKDCERKKKNGAAKNDKRCKNLLQGIILERVSLQLEESHLLLHKYSANREIAFMEIEK